MIFAPLGGFRYSQSFFGGDSKTARIVPVELAEKSEGDVKLTFDFLFAADLSGQARASQSMVGTNMELAKAAGIAGLLASEQ